MSTEVTVSIEDFLSQFPEFAETENMNIYLTRAQNYISIYNYGVLTDNKRVFAIYLLTAHLLTIQAAILSGDTSGLIQASASIDKISVSNVPPPTDEGSYWYFLTPYGQQLLELFEFNCPIPMYFGGSYVRVLQ